MFSVVREGESSYSWKLERRLLLVCGGGKRGMLVVALIRKRESLLSVWDRGDSLLSVRKDRTLK